MLAFYNFSNNAFVYSSGSAENVGIAEPDAGRIFCEWAYVVTKM